MRKLFLAVSIVAVALATLPGHAGPVSRSVPMTGFKVHPGRILSFGSRDSSNWSGYDMGFLSDGRTKFNQISGSWTVPTPSLHTSEDEYSVNWVGIGGGCVNQGCSVTDATLIQAGSGQYISAAGVRTYFAWWEIIPGPILQITNFPVRAGDRMYVDIRQTIPFSDFWKIQVTNQTTGQTYTTSIEYASTHLTAEWVEERPSIGGLPAPLPSLTNPRFNNGYVNKFPVHFTAGMEMTMSDGTQRLATPSGPDPDRNGFNVCTYTTGCGAPTTN